MANFYSIDPSTPAPYSIVDVTKSEQFESSYYLVVRAPESLPTPANLTDLLASKLQAIQDSKPNYTRTNTFSCLNSTQFDLTASSGVYFGGGLRHMAIKTEAFTLPVTLSGSAPDFCVGYWDAYKLTDTDDKTKPYSRKYQGLNASAYLGVLVSFDNGATFNNLGQSGVECGIPAANRGTNMIVQIINYDPSVPIYLESLVILSNDF